MKVYIDYLRVFAALAVICIHVTATMFNKEGGGDLLILIINKVSLWAVPVFVMISGALLLGEKKIEAQTFIKKRIKRLLPAFIFWNILYFGIYQLISDQYTIWERFNMFSDRLYTASHLWYLPMFILLMLIVPFLGYFINGIVLKKNELLFLVFLFVVDLSIRQIARVSSTFKWLPIFNEYIGFFFLGYVMDKYFYKIKSWLSLVIFICLVSLGIVLEYNKVEFFYFDYSSLSNTLISVFVFLFFANLRDLKDNYILKSIADTSFGIYLIHLLFINVFDKLGLIRANTFLYIIVLVALCSYLSIYFLRKFELGRKIC